MTIISFSVHIPWSNIFTSICTLGSTCCGKDKAERDNPRVCCTIIGMIVSAITNVCGAYNANHSQFQFANIELGSSVFYFALLPPIIHSSAYSVRRKDLLKNWDAVCLLAFLGSMISILVMTFVLQLVIQVFVPNLEVSVIELLTFSSLISSVDPVNALAVFSKLRVDLTSTTCCLARAYSTMQSVSLHIAY